MNELNLSPEMLGILNDALLVSKVHYRKQITNSTSNGEEHFYNEKFENILYAMEMLNELSL